MGFISNEIIASIRERTDIIQIIGEYVRITPAGNSYRALCPFHKEKTPSFHVVADKQIYHCFGCGKGGDVFAFLMELERLSFPEAVKMLAERCGIDIPKEYDPEQEERTGLYELLGSVSLYYAACLKEQDESSEIWGYIRKRNILPETVEKFCIGYAPNNWNSLARRFGKTPEFVKKLESLDLIRKRDSGDNHYDFFRNRLMIPIFNIHGHVAGFGSRVLPSDIESYNNRVAEGDTKAIEPAKYRNSSESDTFRKRNMLFNFREALPSIKRTNSAIIVEGYLDAISLWQSGIKNVVAALGTAISSEQIHMLARNCETLYFCYDADAAGQRAALRAVSMQKDAPVDARIVTFDNPLDDPDSFVSREGSESFKKLLEKAVDIYTFLIETRTHGLKLPLEINVKEKLIQEFKEFVPDIHSSIARSEVIRKISKLLDMDPALLSREFAGKEQAITESQRKRNFISPGLNAEIQRQEWVLMHLLEHPEDLGRVKALLDPEDFSDSRLRKIFEAFSFQQEAASSTLKPAEILAALDDPALVSRLSELITTLGDRPDEPFMECVKGLVKSRLESSLKILQQSIREAERNGEDSRMSQLSLEQISIKRKIDSLY